MFENPRRGRQARNFATNVPKILDLKSSSEQMFSYNWRWVPLKRVYLLFFHTALETKLGEFQFKILNRIVFTNEKFFRFDMAESDKCSFCQTEVESIEHLLFSCKVSSVLWKHVLSWLRDNNIVVENLKEEDIIFGKFDVGDDFLLVNHVYCLGSFIACFIHKNVKRVIALPSEACLQH